MSVDKNQKIGLIYGGLSSESDISRQTGKAMLKALQNKGYQAVGIDVGKDIVQQIVSANVEVVVNGLHGKLGEDGTVQGLLECLGIPYTGSGVMASAVAMNKILTKNLAIVENVLTPQFKVFDTKALRGEVLPEGLSFPVVVKSQAEGSSRGTVIVKSAEFFKAAVEEAKKYDHIILAEEFVEGPQVTVSILNGRTLPLIEIVPKKGFYDYEAKYTKGATEYIIPARVRNITSKKASEAAIRMYNALQCRGCARTDFMVDQQGQPQFIEINTLPGMTETSLVPMAAKKAGISFEDLIEQILQSATLDHAKITKS